MVHCNCWVLLQLLGKSFFGPTEGSVCCLGWPVVGIYGDVGGYLGYGRRPAGFTQDGRKLLKKCSLCSEGNPINMMTWRKGLVLKVTSWLVSFTHLEKCRFLWVIFVAWHMNQVIGEVSIILPQSRLVTRKTFVKENPIYNRCQTDPQARPCVVNPWGSKTPEVLLSSKILGGGFKYVLFSPLVGEDSHFDSYFSAGLKPPTRINQLMVNWC